MNACACGQPLHYTDPKVQAMVQTFVDACGPTITVTTEAGSWRVPRHFIALHGLAADALPELAERFGFERVDS